LVDEAFKAWRFVVEALVAKKLVVVTLVPVTFVDERFVMVPLVAKRLVVVTEVPVAFVKVVFWRDVSPTTVKVPVTVPEEAINPPRSCKVAVATAPRFVTVRRVSASGVTTHPVPFERQMPTPPTVAVVKFALVANR
jgi:hypothetical protein